MVLKNALTDLYHTGRSSSFGTKKEHASVSLCRTLSVTSFQIDFEASNPPSLFTYFIYFHMISLVSFIWALDLNYCVTKWKNMEKGPPTLSIFNSNFASVSAPPPGECDQPLGSCWLDVPGKQSRRSFNQPGNSWNNWEIHTILKTNHLFWSDVTWQNWEFTKTKL